MVALNPSYSGNFDLTVRTRSPLMSADTSLKEPSAEALINPGAPRDGTLTTSPSKVAVYSLSSTVQEPVL